jgi:hypothetical protein
VKQEIGYAYQVMGCTCMMQKTIKHFSTSYEQKQTNWLPYNELLAKYGQKMHFSLAF